MKSAESPIISDLIPAPENSPAPDVLGAVTGCWSNMGVYGDGSCIELPKFIHCRNCPVYSAAAIKLLDRPLPPNYREEWTRHFGQERRSPESGNASAILFRIQDDWLALNTHHFQEVAERRPIHSLPHRRNGIVLGLANVRGELVICISIGHLLQMERVPSLASLRADYGRLLVIQSDTNRLAFPVDEVQGPYRYDPQEISSTPSLGSRPAPMFVRGLLQWQERTAAVLEIGPLFSSLDGTLS